MAPESVGPYRVLQKLGSGGMGDVYLAEDTRLRRRVALKSLSEAWARQPDARRRLVHEAQAVAALNHPNIAAVYDVLESEDATYIVMEFVPGQTLAEKIRLGPLDSPAATYLCLQLLSALREAHARGIVHRDLKPANLMLMPDGRLKVLDFGLAKSLDMGAGASSDRGTLDLSESGRRLVGTPPYLPPEHILGGAVDERSDIYGVGVVLFELLTGKRPFDGPSAPAIAEAIVSGRTPRVRELAPAVSPPLDDIVARAMARRPEDRYESVSALRADLERLRDAEQDWPTVSGVEAVPSPSPRLRSERRLRKRRLVATSLGLLAVAGGVAYWRWPAPAPPSRVPVVAVLPLLDASGDSGNESLGLGVAEVLVTELSRLPKANVLSRAAAASYHERGRNPVRIARELGADFVVDGVLQRSADDLRVTLSLVQATSGLVVWSDVYDGPLRDVFVLQRRAAEAVARALRLSLTPEDLSRIRRGTAIAAGAFADYAHARELFEQADVPSNLERAIALFGSALAKDPRFALAAAGLGEAQWARYKHTLDPASAESARQATRDALRLDPEQPLVRIALATIDLGTGRLEEAEQELQRAIEQQPDNDEAHEALGRVLSERGQRDRALLELERAVELRPKYWRHVDALGLAHFDAGRHQEAIEAFRRVTVLRPESARGFHQLGTAQQALGDRKAALASYRRALALEPDGDTWSNVGTLLYEDGRLLEAAEAFTRATALLPAEPALQRNLGDAYARLGRSKDAREAYRRAVELTFAQLRVNPKDARSWGRLAVYQAKVGDHRAAAEAAKRGLNLAPETADVLYGAAAAAALAGEVPRAVELLRRALRAGYSREFARVDEDLAALRDDPEYQRLMSVGKEERGGGVK